MRLGLCTKIELGLSRLALEIIEGEPDIWSGDGWLQAIRRGVRVFIVVGTWEGSELFDRLVAYAILNELGGRGVEGLVLTDTYWRNAASRYGGKAIISVGGPPANSISHEIARELGIGDGPVAGFRRLWGRLVGYAWGPDARGTIRAGREFVECYLDEFVGQL